MWHESNGVSPSGKAAGFGPAISEVRVLPPQPFKKSLLKALFLVLVNKVQVWDGDIIATI